MLRPEEPRIVLCAGSRLAGQLLQGLDRARSSRVLPASVAASCPSTLTVVAWAPPGLDGAADRKVLVAMAAVQFIYLEL